MSDFIETAKQKIGKGINRVSWEADKLRRANAKQGELNTLKQDRDQVILDFSNTVLTMYRQGSITDPQLRQYCERILDIEQSMTTKAAELEQIRSEMYPGAPDARANMGGSANSASASSSVNQSPEAGRGTGMTPCPTCGEPVRTRALYCNKCGTKLR
ncbi:MAG TPA: zinc ribbon domain-containing protein [Ktedonobacterales bacterium]|nr:zinc ribbon domain-containing protein [Ktedonobacterales bacterium]